ncbi:ABC transporter substrate-binding protein [Alsobacter sp. R-9]
MIGPPLTRRAFAASTVLLLAGRPARAQANGPVVAFVSWFAGDGGDIEDLKAGLKEYGHVVGSTITLDAVFTNGDRDRTRQAILDAVARRIDVLVVRATATAHLAKDLAPSLPVVMLVAAPLATGLVPSLSRPGGHMTGLSLLGPDHSAKRLAFFQLLKPGMRAAAFLGSSADPNAVTFAQQTQAAGHGMGIAVDVRLVEGPRGIGPGLMRDIADKGADVLIVQPIFSGHEERIVGLATDAGLPVISNYRSFAQAGALLTYGPDEREATRRAAYYIQRILKGASPGDLPIEQPSRFVLTLNGRTARSMGLSVPAALSTQADELIE